MDYSDQKSTGTYILSVNEKKDILLLSINRTKTPFLKT